jgi:hypothetical protein
LLFGRLDGEGAGWEIDAAILNVTNLPSNMVTDQNSNYGEFFAIALDRWHDACALGMNAAVAYLVLARGSARDNVSTAWSVNAIETYTGISRGRARQAVERLVDGGLVRKVSEGLHPRYKLVGVSTARSKKKKLEDLVWLPNALVTSAAGEVAPVERVRQTQDVMVLRLLVDLYSAQNLREDGGIDRRLIWQSFKRDKIGERAQWDIWAFSEENLRFSWAEPILIHRGQAASDGADFLVRFGHLQSLGLIEWIPYLFESDMSEAEPIHPCGNTESDSLEDQLGSAAYSASLHMLPHKWRYISENYPWAVPVLHHLANVQMIGIARLRYRPHTKITAAWWADFNQTCDRYLKVYAELKKSNQLAADADPPSTFT